MDTITVSVDDRQELTNGSSVTVTNGTFYLSNRKNGKPNWKLAIAIALLTTVVGLAVVIVLTIKSNQNNSQSSSSGINFPVSSSPLGVYRFASVSADAGRCSQIGTSLLARGGSAVDAAIAACLCTGIYNMHNAGIGGGFLMTIWDQKSQTAYALDARETAPLFATEDMFVGMRNASLMGPLSIAIPSEVAGYWAAHQRFGRLPWADLFQPTVDLCHSGVEISEILARAIARVFNKTANVADQAPYTTLKQYLINPKTDKPFTKGDFITCPTLAITLSQIGKLGAPGFYNGSIAADILLDLQDIGSKINKTDFSSYSVTWRKPVELVLPNKQKMLSIPPPGAGAVLALALNILAGYNWSATDKQELLSYHRFVESFKFAYAKRLNMGDESFVPAMESLVANLTNPEYGDYIRSLINDSSTHPTDFYTNVPSEPRNHGTSHISVLDADGNAVSVTSTINVYFGSLVMGKRTGIIFNDEMDDFSTPDTPNYFKLPPSPENFIKPGKRPQSTMCPAIFVRPDNSTADKFTVSLVVGSAGGSRITSSTAYVAARILWFQENPKEAIDALRLHHQLIPETLVFEPGFPVFVLDWLRQRGHVNQTRYDSETGIMSVAQAIQKLENGTIFANADYRKHTFADGF